MVQDVAAVVSQSAELYRLSKNFVHTHFKTAAIYGPGTNVEYLGLATTIDNVAAGNAVEISIAISGEPRNDAVVYVKRNGTEIGSLATAGSRNVGLIMVPYDNNQTNYTGFTMVFRFIDDAPDAGTNAYTFHVRLSTSDSDAINQTLADQDAVTSERVTSSIILRELQQ